MKNTDDKNTDDTGNRSAAGVETRSTAAADIRQPDDQEQLDDGPAMTTGGAMPGGSTMNHWVTASPDADATRPETMPHTKSTPMPGETKRRTSV